MQTVNFNCLVIEEFAFKTVSNASGKLLLFYKCFVHLQISVSYIIIISYYKLNIVNSTVIYNVLAVHMCSGLGFCMDINTLATAQDYMVILNLQS